MDINGEPNWQQINGWRPCYSGRKPSEGRRWTHHHLLQLNKQPQHCRDDDPSSISNENGNSGLNSEPWMPLLGPSGAAWKRGEPRKASGTPLCPSTTAPQTLPGVYSAPGTNPWDTAELARSPTLLPARHPVPGAQLHKGWGAPGQSQKLPEPSPPAKTRRAAPQGQLHWCHFRKLIASLH